MSETILYYAASFIAVAIVLSFHEFAHAYAAHRCGDDTAKYHGRLTVNPVKHFDPLGLLMFTFVGFGWAKPVPINPYNFKNYKKGMILTSSAGVIMNYVMAFLAYPIYLLFMNLVYPLSPNNMMIVLLSDLLYFIYLYSLSFCVFNLLPFYPLDGFRIVDAFSKRESRVLAFLRRYGYYILLGLIAESFICGLFVDMGLYFFEFLDVLGWLLSFARSIVSIPITLAWGWII